MSRMWTVALALTIASITLTTTLAVIEELRARNRSAT